MSRLALSCLFLVVLIPLWSQHPLATSPNPSPTPAPLPIPTPVGATGTRVDAPNHVDAGSAYYRCYAIVPLVGSGKPGDPRRPMYAPFSGVKQVVTAGGPSVSTFQGVQSPDHSGILSFQMVASDDKSMALVEFVATTRASLNSLLASTEPSVQVFERGVTSKTKIEGAFQKYKKSFSFDSWTSARPQ